LPEVAGAAGAYFDPERPDQLAASIDRVLGDAALRERMRQAGLARHRELTWARSAELVEQSFRRTLGRL
jgi:UDP:flavonoid glycosyltransferase YjiC (YdhE family)